MEREILWELAKVQLWFDLNVDNLSDMDKIIKTTDGINQLFIAIVMYICQITRPHWQPNDKWY